MLFNGSNNGEGSKAIYLDWLKQHEGTDGIAGSRSADMRSALVDYFAGARSHYDRDRGGRGRDQPSVLFACCQLRLALEGVVLGLPLQILRSALTGFASTVHVYFERGDDFPKTSLSFES